MAASVKVLVKFALDCKLRICIILSVRSVGGQT